MSRCSCDSVSQKRAALKLLKKLIIFLMADGISVDR